MTAGRPYNSTTPAWRSKPAVKVGMYHFLCHIHYYEGPTKSGCARLMGISRNTVIKWFDDLRWSQERNGQYRAVRDWVIEHFYNGSPYDTKQCSADLALPEGNVRFFMEMYKIEYRYLIT